MIKGIKTPNDYYQKIEIWNKELNILREIVLDCGLVETLKWGIPTYTYKGKNVLSISGFKSYFGIWFHQGALLKDEYKKLMNAQEGKTKALRQWRMSSIDEIEPEIIKVFIFESIENIKAGISIKPNKSKPIILHNLLKEAFNKQPELSIKFNEFTLSKKREFADYINNAKQETTQIRRINKIIPLILAGKGLNDKYK